MLAEPTRGLELVLADTRVYAIEYLQLLRRFLFISNATTEIRFGISIVGVRFSPRFFYSKSVLYSQCILVYEKLHRIVIVTFFSHAFAFILTFSRFIAKNSFEYNSIFFFLEIWVTRFAI